MGSPEHVRQRTLDVDGEDVDVVTLRVGNPQCVVLGEVSEARLRTLAARLAVHPHSRKARTWSLRRSKAPTASAS